MENHDIFPCVIADWNRIHRRQSRLVQLRHSMLLSLECNITSIMTVQNLKLFQLLLHNLQHAEGGQYLIQVEVEVPDIDI